MSEFEEIKRKKFPYRITTSNWVFFSIACLISIGLYILTNDFSAETFGYIVGISFSYLLFAGLFGLLFWFILGRKENGGSYTFNVIIILTLMGQLNQFRVENSEKKKNLDTTELQDALVEYKNQIKNDSIASDEALNTLVSTYENKIDNFIENTSGDEKKLFIGLKEFLNETKKEADSWNNAFEKVNDETFFNFDILQNKNEIDSQIKITEDYINASKRYKDFFKKRLSKLNEIIKDKDINHDFTTAMITTVKKKIKQQSPIFIPYINSHIEYGNMINEILLLAKNNKWKPNDYNIVKFSNTKIQEEFDLKINTLVEIEAKVNDLHARLIEVM